MLQSLLPKRHQQAEADICLIVEGCYPYIPGGVSSWVDWMMRTQPDLTFQIVTIMPNNIARELRFEFPENLIGFHELFLHEFNGKSSFKRSCDELSNELSQALIKLFDGGGLDELRQVDELINNPKDPISLHALMNSNLSWNMLQQMYKKTMPQASFHHYFWAWRALLGGMFAAMKFKVPPAKVYHTISTGYAGLVAARAGIETGRPVIITEHGIYTNERQIEIVMADWIAETVEKGLSLDDDRYDLRDMWINAFQAYARTCYQACSEITTLYEDNQRLQRAMGADESKLKVIANGIDFERFANLDRAGENDRPTIAMIGRVVPIKDIKTFISSAHKVYQKIPNLRVLIMGPTDEDKEYYQECLQLVDELEMDDCLEFTGSVNLTDYMPMIHVVVLTSLSEAQPLVLLEAGASGIACVTSDVGSCREILEGRSDENPKLGLGGIVTDLVAPDQIAESVLELLNHPEKRREYGDNLRQRVKSYYLTEMASSAYSDLYRRHTHAELQNQNGER